MVYNVHTIYTLFVGECSSLCICVCVYCVLWIVLDDSIDGDSRWTIMAQRNVIVINKKISMLFVLSGNGRSPFFQHLMSEWLFCDYIKLLFQMNAYLCMHSIHTLENTRPTISINEILLLFWLQIFGHSGYFELLRCIQDVVEIFSFVEMSETNHIDIAMNFWYSMKR